MTQRTSIGWRELVAVLVGGMVGTAARLGIDTLLPHTDSAFPLGTLLINVGGSFALGAVVSLVWAHPTVPTWSKAGLGAGALGSFTTFSAVMVSLVAQTASGQWLLAIGYLMVSVILGLAAAEAGLRVAGRPTPQRQPRTDWVDE